MALINQASMEAKLGRSMTSAEASAFTTINAAVQAHVEDIIGSAVEDVSASTRYFDGGFQHLPIDFCTNITSVTLRDDDQVVTDTYDATDYTTEPVNSTLKSMLRHRSGPFMTGINNIGVTAKFSIYNDANSLAIVKQAILELCDVILNNVMAKSKESIEGYSVENIDMPSLVVGLSNHPALSAFNSKFIRII